MMLNPIGQFPEISSEPVHYQEHPYKMFALVQVMFIFWRALEIVCHEKNESLEFAQVFGYGLLSLQNFSCVYIMAPHSHRLEKAVKGAFMLQFINFLDVLLPSNIDRLEENALPLRVSLLVGTILLSLGLIAYANCDRPYVGRRL